MARSGVVLCVGFAGRTLILPFGCDSAPGVASVGAGFHGPVVVLGLSGRAAVSSAGGGELTQAQDGVVGELGEGGAFGQVQQHLSAVVRERGRDRVQPQP